LRHEQVGPNPHDPHHTTPSPTINPEKNRKTQLSEHPLQNQTSKFRKKKKKKTEIDNTHQNLKRKGLKGRPVRI